jgi:hypothetical protein
MYFHSHFLPDLQYYHAIEGGRSGELYHQYRSLPIRIAASNPDGRTTKNYNQFSPIGAIG